MVVHLGAGLAQCLGQLINVWSGSLPVVVLTFAGDTGSYGDRVGLDLTHDVGPTSIAKPFTKASWTVIEPDGCPRRLSARCALPKHRRSVRFISLFMTVCSEMKWLLQRILEGEIQSVRAGYPADEDVEAVIRALSDAQRPLFYVGDGIWKEWGRGAGYGVGRAVWMPDCGYMDGDAQDSAKPQPALRTDRKRLLPRCHPI